MMNDLTISTVASLAADLKAKLGRPYPGSNMDSSGNGILAPCDPDCPICAGAGYVRRDVPVCHPMFGKLDLCPNADPLRMASPERYGLTEWEMRNLTWDKLLPLPQSNAIDAAAQMREILKREWGWVYLWGDYGLAKTLILQIAVAESLRSHTVAAFTSMTNLLNNVRAAYDLDDPSDTALIRLDWWQQLPVLAIDEFEKINITAWAAEQRFRLLDARHTDSFRERQSITLIASNIPPEDLADGALASRIRDKRNLVIKVTGSDARRGMGMEDRI